MTNEEVVQQVLHWSEPDRADLVFQLLQSLDAESVPDPDVVKAWGEEAKRRLEMHKRGDLEWHDWDEFCHEMQEQRS